jgi:hypothetical protein
MSDDLTKAVELVRNARAEAWARMAKKLPDHHILSVELFRTEQDETLAVFTLVRNGRPVQQVLRANSRGVDVKAVVPNRPNQVGQGPCSPIEVRPNHHVEALTMDQLILQHVEALKQEALRLQGKAAPALAPLAAPPAPPVAAPGDGSANTVALGEPPPKQEPEPGVISVGTAVLPLVFDVAERATEAT